jgi:N-acyl-D-aspartate/D-glutamate deacylase
MDDSLQTTLLLDSRVSICSDGSPTGFHPRGHGTFAKVIEEYVVQQKRLPLAEAVRKMTSLPAAALGIEDRGSIEVGKAADLVVFDPQNVRATATYTDPLRLAQGFDIVIVNGQIARRGGDLAAAAHGRVLLPRR